MKTDITLEDAARLLLLPERILILTHARPDGDTLGSAFALKHALEGKDVRVVCADPIPARLTFICDGQSDLSLDPDFEPEFICAVDCAELGMMGTFGKMFEDHIDLKIDHHLTSVPYAAYNFIDSNAAACAEIIYKLIPLMGKLNIDSARALYCGIATDTGCFKFRNVSADSHRIAAELLDFGINAGELNHLLFEEKSPSEINATKAAFNSLKYYCDGKIAVVNFSNRLKGEYGITDEDLSALNGLPREIAGVELGITIKQVDNDPGEYKVSMRTGELINASSLCALFGGGGHIRAAGCSVMADSPEEAEEMIINAVKGSVEP